AALILVLHLRPRGVDVLLLDDERVVDADGPGDEAADHHQHHDQDDETATHAGPIILGPWRAADSSRSTLSRASTSWSSTTMPRSATSCFRSSATAARSSPPSRRRSRRCSRWTR